MTSNDKKYDPQNSDLGTTQFIEQFFAEIKVASQKTNAEIALALDPQGIFALNGNMVSQYLNGQRVLSENRFIGFVKRAHVLGWHTPLVEGMIGYFKKYPDLPLGKLQELREEFKQTNKKSIRSEKAAIAAYEKSIARLVELNWDAERIVGLSIMLTKKLMHQREWSSGRMINPAWMVASLEGDGTHYPDMAWLHWHIMPLEEYSKYLEAKSGADMSNRMEFSSTTKIKDSAKPKVAKKSPAKRTTSSK
jgi:hypothetical protein